VNLSRMTLAVVAALAATAALAFAAPAPAAVISIDGDHYTYTAAPGEANDLRITYYTADAEILFDDRVAIDASQAGGCVVVSGDPSNIACPIADGTVVDLGDQNDYFEGGDGGEVVHGGAGNDDVRGDGGDDVLDGGPGDDDLEKGSPASRAGNDLIVGGDGTDTAWYTSDFYSGTEPVKVTLDGAANDGMAGEADNVQTENVHGGERDDVLVGDAGPNHLDGGSGADELHGGGGDDFVDGGVDADRVLGEAGNDKVYGGDSADDIVDGGPGADEILGDGICFYSGCNTGGNDTIHARDGEADTIDCGGGYDSGDADAIDHLTGGACEALAITGPAASCCAPPPAPANASLAVRAPAAITYRELVRRGLPLDVHCPASCALDARLLVARRSAGHAARAMRAAGTLRMRVKPSASGRRRLRRRSSLILRVAIRQGQATTTKSLRVRVRH
jgi:Ca2+-binding RTX toxin-like protein